MPQVTSDKSACWPASRTSPIGPLVAGPGAGWVMVLSFLVRSVDCLSVGAPKVNGSGGRCQEDSGVHFATAFECTAERDLVGVLEVAPHWEPAGDAGHPKPQRLEQPSEVHRRRLPFDVRVGGEDHFLDSLVVHPCQELLDLQLVRSDALDRRDRAEQHVVQAAVLLSPLDGDDVAWFLDDAQQRGITSVVAAVHAQVALGEVEAPPAPAHALLRLDDGARKTLGVIGRALQQKERDALRRFGADAREASQLVDQALHRPFEGGCHLLSAERAAETRAETAEIEPAGDTAHPLGLELLCASHRFADRRDHEVLEHLDVVGVDHVARDPHGLDVAGARHDSRHLAATCGSFDEFGGQLVLRRGHVGLHLLHLAHHLVELLLVRHVRLTPAYNYPRRLRRQRHSWWRSSTTVAPNDSVSRFVGPADSTPGGVALSSGSMAMSSCSSGSVTGGADCADAARSPLNPSCAMRLKRRLVPTCWDSAARIA